MTPPYLPPEMVAGIAAFLDGNTLLNFRAATKAHKQASERTFLERFFTKRVHLYTSRSLGQLLHICQSSHLVKRLQMIQIVQPDNGISDEDAYVDWYGPPGDIAWEAWIQDSQAIKDDDTTLRDVFCWLKRSNVSPDISVQSSARPYEHQPYGFRAYKRPWKPKGSPQEDIWRFRHDLCDVASYGLVIAASISLAPIKVLTLKDICDPTLSRLYADDDVQKRHSTSFFTALSNMTSLESISLSFGKDPSDVDGAVVAHRRSPQAFTPIKYQAPACEWLAGIFCGPPGPAREHLEKNLLRRCWHRG